MSEAIWVTTPNLVDLNTLHENTAVERLAIEMVAVGDNFLSGRMPVDQRTKQPFGLMHGGAAVLLLETLASAAANHCVDPAKQMCVGVEINCNHVRGVRQGYVKGTATALHVGRTSMVWGLEAHDEQGRLVTVGRLTAAVVPAT
jgi:1,4-dihydroxy-2-naphthoyl-CoA hydrolase